MTSKPSGPQHHPSDRESSTRSWKPPEPADVLSYAYLWADEHERGQQEGLKDRPVVVVIARTKHGGQTQLWVAPVTHSEPASGDGVEIPPPVKRHLGLDQSRSWIIATELNRFTWPGPDVRIAPGGDSAYYGEIPAKLFERLRSAILDNLDGERVRIPTRSE
jgi:hypothetical protein